MTKISRQARNRKRKRKFLIERQSQVRKVARAKSPHCPEGGS